MKKTSYNGNPMEYTPRKKHRDWPDIFEKTYMTILCLVVFIMISRIISGIISGQIYKNLKENIALNDHL
jgi:hypothetical protein